MNKRVLRKIFKIISRIFILFLILIAIYILVPAYPHTLFKHTMEYGNFTVYSDKKFPDNIHERLANTDWLMATFISTPRQSAAQSRTNDSWRSPIRTASRESRFLPLIPLIWLNPFIILYCGKTFEGADLNLRSSSTAQPILP